MKKLLPSLFLLILATGAANAQRRATVSGVVANADSRETIIGAVVQFVPTSDSTRSVALVSGAGGAFSTGLDREKHRVRVSLLGYEPLDREVDVTDTRQTLDTLYLREGIRLDDVVVSAAQIRTSVSGDTLIYNADAYKTAADADVAGLLAKMPGIKVDGGAVEAQGETVKKVLIDNRELFGDDVAAAISSLPAEAVKNVEVFDKLSDNAEFTGIDDGEGYKAINIVTRESMRQGVMGQVSAMYGAEPPETGGEDWNHYGEVGGNVNIFQGDSRVSVGGTLNNVNKRNFTNNDFLGVGADDGIAKVGRLQLGYVDQLGKKNQWSIDATYMFNATDADANTTIDREYYSSDDALYRNYYSSTTRNTVNTGHNLIARIDFKPNANHELRIRPMIRYQGNRRSSDSSETYFPVDESAGIDLGNWSNSDQTGFQTGLNANYRVRLGKPGRTLSAFFNTNYSPEERTGESYSERQELAADGSRVYVRQSTPSSNYDFGVGAGVTYTEPVSDNSLVNFDYSINYNYSDQDKKAYEWDYDGGTGYITEPSANLSGVYNSGYTIHRVGPGYRMQKGKSTLSLGAFYQYSTLESNRVLPAEYNLRQSFNNITYAAMLNSQFTNGTSIRMFLHSMTRNPSVFDLTDVADLSNVQNISRGNLDLKPSYNNMFMAWFTIPSITKGRTFSINAGGNYTGNAIVQRTVRESPGFQIIDSEGNVVETLDAVGSYSETVNMDGQWSARVNMGYGFPVRWLRSNVNLDAGLNYSESPSQLGKWSGGGGSDVVWTTNIACVLSPKAGITIGSNISDKADFRVSYNTSYNSMHNTAFSGSNSAYLQQNASVSFKFVLPASFTLSGDAAYSHYNSLSGQTFCREYVIANAAVGKKVLRSRMAEISLFVNDIFNQNIGFRRSAQAQYIQNQIDSAIGRYVGVKFTWNIRKFGKKGSTDESLYDTGRGRERFGDGPLPGDLPAGGPPLGGPPPGGGFGGGRGM